MFGWQNLCPLDFYLDNLKIQAFGFGKIKDFKTQNQWIANDIKPKEFHKVSHWMATLKKPKYLSLDWIYLEILAQNSHATI